MKRKFGFGKPAPIKTPKGTASEVQGGVTPPLTPIINTVNRQQFSPQTLAELRQACARVVVDVGPSGAEYEDILNQQDPLEKYNSERNANKDYRSHNYNPQPSSSKNRRRPEPEPKLAPYVHVPTNAARDFKASTNARSRSYSNANEPWFEPLEPTHTKVSGRSRTVKAVPDDPLAQIKASLDNRPKTSAAACIDYKGPSAGTSSSTSRTATTYDPVRPSTGLTSQAITPANEKRISQQRVSEQVLKDGPAAALADATAKAWMAQELDRRRGTESAQGAYRPSRGASLRRGSNAGASEHDRPRSRAGSIRSGIKDYIRPRASSDSMRSFRSDNGSRPPSRGDSSQPGLHSWWRGATSGLRRKGSWSSFRSARTNDGEGDAAEERSGKSKEVNLNRSLPALPGLDQYVEPKEPKLHIAQLMARRPPPIQTQHSTPAYATHNGGATVIDEDGLARTLSAEEESQRQADLRRLVQEKMLHGSISPTTSSGTKSLGRMGSLGGSAVGSRERAKGEKAENEKQSLDERVEHFNEKTPTAAAVEVRKTLPPVMENMEAKKKGGFKLRMSRFLGGDKRMVAAN
ncbi:hypothetical protein MMC30_001907 [Trapelia coarctata]|nr:hypothetical protein [Trapelia coarctata]